MPPRTLEQLLDELNESKRRFDSSHASVLSLNLLAQIERHRFRDAHALIRFHEILLFMRAYPQSAGALRRVEKILNTFAQRVRALVASGANITPLEEAEVSGISRTFVEDTYSYHLVRRLVQKHPSQVSINWDWHEDEYRLGATWPRFLPLLEEDAMVEAHVPYLDWLHAAKNRNESDLQWLISRFERLPLTEKEKAELFESLKLVVRWDYEDSRSTRTRMKRSVRRVFYHTEPLISRRDISLARELDAPPVALEKLSRTEGERVLDMARETSALRYRELYGFTHGDGRHVLRADIGRGVEVFITGVPAERRLPLRAYHAGLVFKNGVPVCYVEVLTIFERMEVGFNVYYTFREGESAWIFARLLKVFRQMMNVTVFSIDPYQLGHENEEGIESGAFWFYRKLGFRPVTDEPAEILKREERRLAARPGYRTTARTLRKLAAGHALFELREESSGEWDDFRIRNVGLAVQRRMASRYRGDAVRMRRACLAQVSRLLGIDAEDLNSAEQEVFKDLSLVLALIPDLARWTQEEKRDAARIIRAKAANDESRYVRLLQRHAKLRAAIIKMGS